MADHRRKLGKTRMQLIGGGGAKNQVWNIRVMPDEWSDLSVRAGHGNAPIDPTSEICEGIFKVMMGNLHNV